MGDMSRVEVMRLVQLLIDGERPGVVVFYDGYNDIVSALNQGKAGKCYAEAQYCTYFNNRNRAGYLLRRGLNLVITKSATFQVLERLTAAIPRETGEICIPKELEAEIVEQYCKNIAFVQKLGDAYGFQCMFFWQPNMLSGRGPLEAEKPYCLTPDFDEVVQTRVFPRISNMLSSRLGDEFIDLSSLLDDRTEPMYLDCVHLTEEGNRVVAQRMASILQERLCLGQKAGRTGSRPRPETKGPSLGREGVNATP